MGNDKVTDVTERKTRDAHHEPTRLLGTVAGVLQLTSSRELKLSEIPKAITAFVPGRLTPLPFLPQDAGVPAQECF